MNDQKGKLRKEFRSIQKQTISTDEVKQEQYVSNIQNKERISKLSNEIGKLNEIIRYLRSKSSRGGEIQKLCRGGISSTKNELKELHRRDANHPPRKQRTNTAVSKKKLHNC